MNLTLRSKAKLINRQSSSDVFHSHCVYDWCNTTSKHAGTAGGNIVSAARSGLLKGPLTNQDVQIIAANKKASAFFDGLLCEIVLIHDLQPQKHWQWICFSPNRSG